MRKPLALTFLLVAACGGERLFLGGGGDSGCVPGVYVGIFTCVTGPDGSANSTATGSVTVELEGDRGGAELSTADGAVLAGMSAGEDYQATFSGNVDCSSYRFQAAFGQATFTAGGMKLATLYQTGTLSADYAPSDGGAALVDGMIAGGLPGAAGAGFAALQPGECTWSATLK